MVGIKIKAIDGSVKKLTLVKNKMDRVNYKYKLNGELVSRKEVIDACLKVLDGRKLTQQEIVQETGLDEIHIYNIMQKMRDNELIKVAVNKSNRFTLYTKRNDCLLAEMFYPTPKDIENQFTVKGKTVRKVEQGTSKSTKLSQGVTYNASHYDSLDW
jgi:hypothetical protein